MEYRTKDGDMVDQIALAVGGGSITAEAIYNANPNLADMGPKLPAGMVLTLPKAAQSARPRKLLRLWGKG